MSNFACKYTDNVAIIFFLNEKKQSRLKGPDITEQEEAFDGLIKTLKQWG